MKAVCTGTQAYRRGRLGSDWNSTMTVPKAIISSGQCTVQWVIFWADSVMNRFWRGKISWMAVFMCKLIAGVTF